MKKLYLVAVFLLSASICIPSKANFGDADFPVDMFNGGPKSYHDAWCRKIKQECRIRFQGSAMWVEGQGGIYRDQYKSYRYEKESREFYNYVSYIDDSGRERVALFLFANVDAQREFIRAFLRWKKQVGRPVPNYRLPASQGPQDTHGRDKSYGVPMNPYERPPITDWKEKTSP